MGDRLELGDGVKDSLILELLEQVEEEGPRPMDANLRVRAKCAGPAGAFAVEANAWVLGDALVSFCEELAALHESGEGEASLSAMVTGDCELHVYSVKGGRLGLDLGVSRRQFRHEARLSFTFERAQLATALAADWVRAYAEGGRRKV